MIKSHTQTKAPLHKKLTKNARLDFKYQEWPRPEIHFAFAFTMAPKLTCQILVRAVDL